jgi:hypothetical protein
MFNICPLPPRMHLYLLKCEGNQLLEIHENYFALYSIFDLNLRIGYFFAVNVSCIFRFWLICAVYLLHFISAIM